MTRPACQGIDNPDVFFPPPGGSPAEAKALCRTCPARKGCLSTALQMGWSAVGVWGGLTENERRPLLKARR